MILITTGRKPSRNSRSFARKLAELIPHSIYLTRGKRNIYSLMDYARSKGLPRVALISDRKGNPNEISFLELSKNEWDWDKTKIKIEDFSLRKKKGKASELRVEGDKKKFFEEVFGIEETDESPDADYVLKTKSSEFVFEHDGEELLKVKIKIIE